MDYRRNRSGSEWIEMDIFYPSTSSFKIKFNSNE